MGRSERRRRWDEATNLERHKFGGQMKTNFSKLGRLGAALAVVTMMVVSVARANDNNDFSHLDPKGLVSNRALSQAVAYFKKNRNSFSNQRYISVIDFTKPSMQKRLFLIDLRTGEVEARNTSHGKGSDPSGTGYARSFSNKSGSNASSLGFYRTLDTYYSSKFKGTAMRLQGLSSTNSNAAARAIVMHPAWYVTEGSNVGRSQGCPALDKRFSDAVIAKIKGGSLLYMWNGQ